MNQDLALNLDILSMQRMCYIIGQTDPLNGVKVNEKNIGKYLKLVNGILKKREDSPEQIHNHYVTAASVYTFVDPVIGLEVMDLKELFIQILGKSPYDVEKPLDLYFQPVGEEPIAESFLEVHRRNLVEPACKERDFFKKTKKLGERVNQEITRLMGQLGKNYSRREHFSFTTYNDICIPLFNLSERRDAGEFDRDYLRENHGTFVLKIPECFQ